MQNENIIGVNFITTNRELINKFGLNSSILLGELYGRRNYFKQKNELKCGYFYATKDSIESSTGLSPYRQRKVTNILKKAGILSVKLIDIPPKTYYKINDEILVKILKSPVV